MANRNISVRRSRFPSRIAGIGSDTASNPQNAVAVGDAQPALDVRARLTAGTNIDNAVSIYGEAQFAGTLTGSVYGCGFNIVTVSGLVGAGGGSLFACQINGIYDSGNGSWGSGDICIYGLKMEYIKGTDTDNLRFPFGLNSDVVPTALFYDQGTGDKLAWESSAGTTSTKDGDLPLFQVAGGTIHYIRTYDARG